MGGFFFFFQATFGTSEFFYFRELSPGLVETEETLSLPTT